MSVLPQEIISKEKLRALHAKFDKNHDGKVFWLWSCCEGWYIVAHPHPAVLYYTGQQTCGRRFSIDLQPPDVCCVLLSMPEEGAISRYHENSIGAPDIPILGGVLLPVRRR